MVETIYSVSHFISYSIVSWLSSLLPNERERELPSLDSMGNNFHLILFILFYHGVELRDKIVQIWAELQWPWLFHHHHFNHALLWDCKILCYFLFSFCVQKIVFFSVCLETPLYLLWVLTYQMAKNDNHTTILFRQFPYFPFHPNQINS